MGSDHCPVYAVTKDRVPIHGHWGPAPESSELQKETHILDVMNPKGMFKGGVRQRDYSPSKDAPALSGKLLPEFTKRRNIRDMFNQKPMLAKPTPTPPISDEDSVGSSQNVRIRPPVDTSIPDKGPTSRTVADSATSAQTTQSHTTSSTLNSPEKRRAPSVSPVKSVKRSKSSLSAAGNNVSSLGKGQQSLKGFFQARAKPADPSTTESTAPSPSPPAAVKGAGSSVPAESHSATDTDLSLPSEIYAQTDPLASQEASKEGWTKLFSKKPPPRCEGHAEPCIILTTKKPGLNCGRQFWMCPRPIGPSGQKETGTQWRCGTFIWASDWKG